MKSEPDNSPVTSIRWADRNAIVEVVGAIDLPHSGAFQEELMVLLEKNPGRIIVDLSRVPYMDSSGLASLVKLLSRSRKKDIDVSLAGLTGRVQSLFEITRLEKVFETHATIAEALG